MSDCLPRHTCPCACHTTGASHARACCWGCQDCGKTITHGERCAECKDKADAEVEDASA